MSNQIIEGYQLSPQQKHLWSLDEGGGLTPYTAQCAILIEGPLDGVTLRAALRDLVERHEILRTTFNLLPDMTLPLQVVNARGVPTVAECDLSGLPEQARETRLESLLRDDARSQPGLEDGGRLRFTEVRMAPRRHVLLVSLPSLHADASALKILMRELGDCYAARLRGEEPPGEQIQYADLSEWQNESLEAEGAKPGIDYWRGRGPDGATPTLPFGKETTEGAEFTPESRLSLVVGRETAEALGRLSALHGSSLQTSLLASFFLVLSRLSSSPGLRLGVCFDGRNYDELSSALGLFARFLPIDAALTPDLPFPRLLASLDASLSEAQRWQEFFTHRTGAPAASPDSAPGPRQSDAPPFFPFCFEFIEDGSPRIGVTDSLSFTLLRSRAYVSRFEVLLRCLSRDDGTLLAEWHYDDARYGEAEVARLAERWAAALDALVALAGEARLDEVEVVGACEHAELLRLGRGAAEEWGGRVCAHELFAAQAAAKPGAVAVVHEGESITYGELDGRANQLARYLRRLGVRAEDRVGLMLGRGVEMLVALLGVLKAGGAYVPLEVSQPTERLARMVEDAGARVVVSVEGWRAEVSALRTEVAVYLDGEAEEISREGAEELEQRAEGKNAAYVIYTSGSTGAPKGVCVEHRQLTNYLNAVSRRLRLPAGASFALVSTFAADLGHTVIFPSLCTGGTLHVISAERATDAGALAEYFRERPVDCLKIVPSHLSALMTHSRPELLLPRECLVLGGEASSWELIERVRVLAPDCRILNHYGPTETTVGVLTHAVEEGAGDCGSKTVPLGRPITNTQAYVLDALLRPSPLGVPGEVHVGGACVARGYLNSPATTAAKFIPNPFGREPGERLYRTGDLARHLPDGSIEFLGRTDDQLKVRGFRTEPGEIEAVLSRHEGVARVKVLARATAAGDKRLVAYLVPDNLPEWTSPDSLLDDVRAYLKDKLPEHMIPSAFVLLESMPLTPNGKIDRRALPEPVEVGAEDRKTFAPPGTQTEKLLAGIWQQVLGLERVGIHDNFFELGGDSILSIQIVARANQAGLRLSPKQLFRHQNVAALSAVVDEASAAEVGAPPVLAEQGLLTGHVPLTPVQSYFFEQPLAARHHFNQSLMLGVRRPVRADHLRRVVTALVEQHDALRLRFEQTEQGWRQRYGGAEAVGEVSVQVVDAREASAERLHKQIETVSDAAQRDMRLEGGGLLRVVLFETVAEQRLLLAAHHLAVDGVSWRVLVEDLAQGLEQAGRGEEITFGRKTSSYREWAERLEEYAGGAAAAAEREYWLRVGKSGGGKLPEDYPDRQNTVESARTVSATLDAEETRALLQEVPEAYRTQINDVLLTAVAEAVSKWSGGRQVLVVMEGHGREELWEDVDVSRTVGWFTALFPVLLETGGATQGGALLKSVKEQLRRVPNRGLVYGLLRYLSKDSETSRELRALPQAELKFNYFGQLDNVLPSDSLFSMSQEARGAERDGKQRRAYLLEINGAVSGGRLQLNLTYSENVHRRATAEALCRDLLESLRTLIEHCKSLETADLSPSDFPLVKLSQQQLDLITSKVARGGQSDNA
ncbi:MAG TPA: amino acid adenylation domain-containing protein [Pyrinomonadaceae bacterium]